MQCLCHLASLPSKDFEFLALNQKVVSRALLQEALKKLPAFLYEPRVLISQHLLLWNGGHVAARPPFVQLLVEGQELVVSSLNLEVALGVAPHHCVLHDGANFDLPTRFHIVHFDWILHTEGVLTVRQISFVQFLVELFDVELGV